MKKPNKKTKVILHCTNPKCRKTTMAYSDQIFIPSHCTICGKPLNERERKAMQNRQWDLLEFLEE